MTKLTPDSLLSLEAYAKVRKTYRADIIAHKRNRTLALGPNITLLFEDEKTMRYQIQEMLRAERIFEPEEIQGELDAYNPLIPDGSNWKATMMIEYPDAAERREMLGKLIGVEDAVWAQVEGSGKIHAIADEDLERENAEKTSSVHFLRFELAPEMVERLRAGAALGFGVDHPAYRHAVIEVDDAVRASLLGDLA